MGERIRTEKVAELTMSSVSSKSVKQRSLIRALHSRGKTLIDMGHKNGSMCTECAHLRDLQCPVVPFLNWMMACCRTCNGSVFCVAISCKTS